MFNHKRDRLNYAEMLMPPDGYEVNCAVATTYSLDLETMTAAALALGAGNAPDGALADSKVALLHSLQKVSEKVIVFSEAGRISLPSRPSPLMLLLEKMTASVALPRHGSGFPSFHPKTWTLEFVPADKTQPRLYRFIVLSRNLTFDRSWDVMLCIDGEADMKQNRQNSHGRPIIEFLHYLNGFLDPKDPRRKTLTTLARALRHTRFKIDSDEFSDFRILPLGIGNKGADIRAERLFSGFPDANRASPFKRLTVMSPFLSANAVRFLNDAASTSAECRLFTRRSELSKISDASNRFDVYVLKDAIIDGENSLPEGDEPNPKQHDIHTKMYLREDANGAELLLGSMNCSNSGIARNVEMMAALTVARGKVNMDSLCADFFGGKEDDSENPFERVDLNITPAPDPDSDELARLDDTLKHFCRIPARATISSDSEKFTVTLQFDSTSIPLNVKIRPLHAPTAMTPVTKEMSFDKLGLLHLSEFYVVTVTGETQQIERVVQIPTDGIPKERNNAIMREIISDTRTFYQYVSMTLGQELSSIIDSGHLSSNAENQSVAANVQLPALYEKMLRTAFENKERLSEIDDVVKMINDEKVVPAEFRRMYKTFKTTLNL